MRNNCCWSFAGRILMAAVVLLSVTTFYVAQLSTGFAQGNLTPPGPPTPGMKTLQQIEPRTPISSLPVTITNSGSYYVTGYLTNAFGDGITISADDVTLDLMGYTLNGAPFGGSAIYVPSDHRHITIRNGTVRGWGSSAVLLYNATWCEIEKLQIVDSGGTGLYIGGNSLVRECTVTNTGSYGIATGSACRLKDCIVMYSFSAGYSLGDKCSVENCTARQVRVGDGFSLGEDCAAMHCASLDHPFGSGFYGADACIFTDCTASRNYYQGIRAGNKSKLLGCVASFNQNFNTAGGIVAQDGSVIKACSADNNISDGITTGSSCSISDCATHSNGRDGVRANYNCAIIGCTAVENTGYGIYCYGGGMLVRNCNASANTAGGIYVSYSSEIVDNVANSNGNGPNVAGIFVADAYARIDGNHLADNRNIGLRVNATNGNVFVIRNSASGTYVTPYSIAPGNRDAQIITPGSGFNNSNPWANFQF